MTGNSVLITNQSSLRLQASKHGIRAKLAAILLLFDILMISFGMILMSWLYLGHVKHERLITFLPLVLIAYCVIAIQQGGYRPSVYISATRSARRACASMAFGILLVISVTFVAKESDELSRGLALAGGLTSATLLVLGRYFFSRHALSALDGTLESEVVLIDGLPAPAGCASVQIDLRAMGIVPDINDPVMLDRLGKMIHEADRVIVSCEPDRRAAWALALKGAGVNVEVLAPELDAIGAISTRRYHGIATALVATGPLNTVDRAMKRAFDLAFAIPLVVFLTPMLIAIALAIRIESPGPILFVQKRVGKGNRMFSMYKFRSMYSDRSDYSAIKLTARNDSRVTRVGKFIRQTSLDELPQLFNVIRGDMSIVGPRPHATGALAGDALYWEVSSQYWSRHAVKPGLTGLAQVNGFRGNTETGDDLLNRLQADLAYLDSWSIWRDLALVLKTFSVLIHRNAF
ncbi:exopolysaccharide biosynthesis polyprenyl glycosylphosphotransferase [Sphingomonas sp. DT-207]|uniref:exopolysaccharide biosynthesis polyprenyl glycosylphosphotransferase n=1 Tax=Sphingomonas sp. DT-207 TaxID=3396167 RepID=UPI003F1C5E38